MGQSIGGPRIRVNAKGIEQKGTTYHWNYQYSGTQPHAPTRIGGRTVDYEASGNQLGWETDQNGTCRTIDGDGANRIQSVADQGRTSTYAYDELGQRVLKAGSGGRTVYINRYYSVRNGAIATKPVFAGDLQIVYWSLFARSLDFGAGCGLNPRLQGAERKVSGGGSIGGAWFGVRFH